MLSETRGCLFAVLGIVAVCVVVGAAIFLDKAVRESRESVPEQGPEASLPTEQPTDSNTYVTTSTGTLATSGLLFIKPEIADGKTPETAVHPTDAWRSPRLKPRPRVTLERADLVWGPENSECYLSLDMPDETTAYVTVPSDWCIDIPGAAAVLR